LQHVPILSHLEITFDQNPWYAESHEHDPRVDHDTLLTQFFAAMTVTGANSLCPKLSSFHIQFTFDAIRSDHYDSVCDLVEARWNVVADERPLTHVHISPENAPRPACDRFEALRLAGLDVNELKEQRSHRGGWMELNPCNGFAWFPDSF
jgi:hypothetical protein